MPDGITDELSGDGRAARPGTAARAGAARRPYRWRLPKEKISARTRERRVNDRAVA
jgi:hypothetical protein